MTDAPLLGRDRFDVALSSDVSQWVADVDAAFADVHGALRDAGFVVDRLLEPGSSDPADSDRDRRESRRGLTAPLPPTVVVRTTPA